MNDPRVSALATLTFGTAVEGGFFAGYINMPDGVYGIVVAPKAAGELISGCVWGRRNVDNPGARSYFDCHANTLAMAEAGSELAQKILAFDINGCTDWALPSRDVLELCYRNLKPTTRKNDVYRYGDNPSSVPPGYPYTEELPAQTVATAFQEGGAEAFSPEWHWSSTQYSAGDAWLQYFLSGHQYGNGKSYEFAARAVRRFKV